MPIPAGHGHDTAAVGADQRKKVTIQSHCLLCELEQWSNNISAIWDERLLWLKTWLEQGQVEE
jgi:hypothetical protein